MEERILFEDAHIVAAFKPYGMLSEPHDSLPSLPAALEERCGSRIFTVHRLDRTTEGLIVYAKTPAAAAKLSEKIGQRALRKEYLAVTQGVTEDGGELRDLLYYDRARSKSYVVSRERRGVKEARLTYERLSAAEYQGSAVSLVRVALITGRTHQIRVQFASRRHPLAGDRRYGSSIDIPHIALCACSLAFDHPMTGEPMRFDCEPTEAVFRIFSCMNERQ